MSKITTVYDAILTRLTSLLSSHVKIPYPYALAENQDNFLRQGYGLKVGSAALAQSDYCSHTYEQTFSVVITREVFNTGSNDTGFDDVAKALLEDSFLIRDSFYESDQIAAEASILKIDPTEVSAIESFGEEKGRQFLTIESTFIFTIKEEL